MINGVNAERITKYFVTGGIELKASRADMNCTGVAVLTGNNLFNVFKTGNTAKWR